jgi:hypothetical protein
LEIQLRGTIRAAVGTGAIEIDVPPEGLPLSAVLSHLAAINPRARLVLEGAGHDVLRVVRNGILVDRAEEPWISPGDSLLLLMAMQGGQA